MLLAPRDCPPRTQAKEFDAGGARTNVFCRARSPLDDNVRIPFELFFSSSDEVDEIITTRTDGVLSATMLTATKHRDLGGRGAMRLCRRQYSSSTTTTSNVDVMNRTATTAAVCLLLPRTFVETNR